MKKCITFLVVISFLINSCISVHAHTNLISTSQYTISEQSGWYVNEGYHLGQTTAYYGFEVDNSNIDSTLKAAVRNGEARWASVCTFNEVSAGQYPYIQISTTSYVSDDSKTDIEILASTQWIYKDSSTGHVSQWKITFNVAYKEKLDAYVASHEFGHTIGLADLYNSNNQGKLMYGYKLTDPGVTTADKNGARVILGLHTSHTMGTSYVPIWGYASTIPAHISFCTNCNIGKIQACTPEIGTCTKCNKLH